MSVLFLLIIIGILVAAGFLAAFIWAVKTGQFDDSYTPSVRILFDDNPENEDPLKKTESSTSDEKPN